MNKHIYKRYYITCGGKYFCRTCIRDGKLYAIWGSKFSAMEYKQITSVNAMKEKLEKEYIQGYHEGKPVEIETIERNFY